MRPGRAIGVITSPGDRLDKDVQEMSEVAAGSFDRIIVYEGPTCEADSRGRYRV